MEFGSSARIDTGGGVVGLSWVAPSTQAEANLVLATSESRVAVVSADDRRLVASWLTRPGSYNKFTCAAIQNRLSRRFFCVQNHNRLFSWHEKDASLERATKLKLRGSVYALRQSKKMVPIAAVYVDGAVSLIAETVAPTAASTGPASDAVVSLAEVAYAAGHTDGSIVTWARMTASPGDDRRFLLMLLMQQPLDADGSSASPPRLVVYVIAPIRSEDAAAGFAIKLAATHPLQQPEMSVKAGSDASARVTAIALHKTLTAVTVVWATGHLQVLQFPHVPAWYTATPTCSFTRKLARFLPVPGATAAADAASADEDGEASRDVGLTVWDARYGVVLGSQHIDEHGDDTIIDHGEAGAHAPAAATASAAGGRVRGSAAASTTSSDRRRSDSLGSSSAPSSAVLNSSLLSSAQAISTATLTPDSVFQVTVSEDNSFVAIASRRRVLITAVAARGASLVSAINRMHHTRTMLAGDDGAIARMRAPPVPRMDMATLLRPLATLASASGEGALAWTQQQQTAWSTSVSSAGDATRAACEALLDPVATPTAAHVLSVLAAKGDMTLLTVPPSEAAADGEAAVVATAGRKRRRHQRTVRTATVAGILPRFTSARTRLSAMDNDGSAALAVSSPDLLHGVPNCLIAVAAQRCISALLAKGEDADPGLNAVAVLRVLLRAGVLSSLAHPQLLSAALTAVIAASHDVMEVRKKARLVDASETRASPRVRARVLLLVDILLHARDIPEAALVDAFVTCVHRVPAICLRHLWQSLLGVSPHILHIRAKSALSKQAAGTAASADAAKESAADAPALTSAAGGVKPPETAAPAAATALAVPAHVKAALVATDADVMGLLAVVALLVRAPRNDVFMEQALSTVSVDDAVILLGCLQQLVQYCVHTLGTVPSEALPPRLRDAGRYMPTFSQVLDWVRMVLDAHFTRLALAAKAPSGEHIGILLRSMLTVVKEQAALADAASLLRGQVLHVLAKGKLPKPGPPEHLVQLVDL